MRAPAEDMREGGAKGGTDGMRNRPTLAGAYAPQWIAERSALEQTVDLLQVVFAERADGGFQTQLRE